MDWYYSLNNQQQGPITEAEFTLKVASGDIPGTSLAWKEGMADWVPVATLRLAPGSAGSSPALAPANMPAVPRLCVECGMSVSPDMMVTVMGHEVCVSCKDLALEKIRIGLPLGGTAWRNDKLLVISDGSSLPDRCIKCGEGANGGRLKRKFFWHHPAYTALVIVNILVYAIVAMCVRKKVQTELGFCDGCRSKRRLNIVIGWLLLLGGFAVGFLGLSQQAYWGFAGVGMVLVSLFWFALKIPVLRPKRIDAEGRGWFFGAHKQFLATLNEWRGT